jgi:hypothetical protein
VSPVDEFSRHERRYTRRGLVSKLERAGLEVRRVTSFVTFLLPPMWLSRTRARRAGDFDPAGEYRAGARADRLLEKAMALDRLVIRGGVNLPVGGSLLVVAVKGYPVGRAPLSISAFATNVAPSVVR